MRARMSDATARGEYERAGGQDAAAHCAVMEARSILAAEEPIGHTMRTGSYFKGIHLPVRDILADALRAFDTMSVAELAEMQTR